MALPSEQGTGERQVHQKVPQLGRVQDVRVIKRYKRGHLRFPTPDRRRLALQGRPYVPLQSAACNPTPS